jgi:hypothetical protein
MERECRPVGFLEIRDCEDKSVVMVSEGLASEPSPVPQEKMAVGRWE